MFCILHALQHILHLAFYSRYLHTEYDLYISAVFYLFYNKTGLFEIWVNNKTTFFEKKQINVFLYKEQEEVIVVFQILSEFLVGYFL